VPTTDILKRIKESTAGKSPAELATMRREIAAYIRGLEPHVAAEQSGGVGEMTRRFGQDGGPQSAEHQATRLERHRAEIEYLDGVLAALHPGLAAQAKTP
jgi:hypothetical protein